MFHICDIYYNDLKKTIIDRVFIKNISEKKAEIIMASKLKIKKSIIMLHRSYDYPAPDSTYDIINTLLKTKYNKELVSRLDYKVDNLKLIILKSKLNYF